MGSPADRLLGRSLWELLMSLNVQWRLEWGPEHLLYHCAVLYASSCKGCTGSAFFGSSFSLLQGPVSPPLNKTILALRVFYFLFYFFYRLSGILTWPPGLTKDDPELPLFLPL